MIARLTGKVVEMASGIVILDVNGVGYSVACTRNCQQLLQVDQDVTITVHTEVREDSISLYGFEDLVEKRVFLLLKTVKGLGAKTSFDILGAIDKHDLLRAIGSSDITRIQAIKGVGKKTAERIIVELRDRVASEVVPQSERLGIESTKIDAKTEAIEALCALGFSGKVAKSAVDQAFDVISGEKDTSALVRQALQYV